MHSDFRQACISKMAGRRAKRIKVGPRGWVFSVHRVLLTLKCLRSFWGHWIHFDFRKTSISKTAGRRAKQSEIWARGWEFNVHRVLLTLQSLRSFWGHSVHSDSHQASKVAGHRAKRSEIWAPKMSMPCTQCTFDTSVIKVILGSFGSFWFSKKLSQKRLVVERNRVKFGPRGRVFSVHRVFLTLQSLR